MAEYQKIYNLLRSAGLTEAGALGVLGNWDCESNCEPGRVQGDFSSYRSVSKAYVNALNSGQLDIDRFANDQKGFGVAQWTYFTRKRELYQFWKSSGLPIDSAELQVAFAIKELKRDFSNDFQTICTTNDIYVAVKAVCARFENPAIHNIDARFQAAGKIKYQIDLNSWQGTELPSLNGSTPASQSPSVPINYKPELIPATEYWPPRDVDRNMSGYDVMVLQAVLKARGYPVTFVTGDFDETLEDIVKQFQDAHNLGADGVVGPKTWRKLLEMSLV